METTLENRRRQIESARLYVLLTEALCAGPWLETAKQVIAGGADCIQLREKNLSNDDLIHRARRLAALCRAAGVLCIVNDRPDVARRCGADGVHVGQNDAPVGQARKAAGTGLLVGISTHTIQQAREAMKANPDYIAVGPMFPTETKPQNRIASPALVSRVRAETSIPVVAIGGIDENNLDQVVQAGARCVCICRAVIGRADPEAAARALTLQIDEATCPTSTPREANSGD